MNSSIKSAVLAILTLVTTSYASLSIQAGKNDLLTWICLAFVGLLIGCQLIPGLTRLSLFTDIIQGREQGPLHPTIPQHSDLATPGKGKK